MKPAIWTGMYVEYPLHEAIEKLHACGWQIFEISSEHLVAIETAKKPNELIKKVQSWMIETGIEIPQAHSYLQADIAASEEKNRETDIRRVLNHIEIAAQLGVREIVVHPGGGNTDSKAEQNRVKQQNIAAFRRLNDYGKPLGVRICIENLTHTGATTPAELLNLIAEISRPEIGITLDTSHAHMSGIDIAKCIIELGDNLFATHISDNNGSKDQHLTPGSGTIDWPSVMKAFQKINYEGLINFEIPGERHKNLALRKIKTRYSLEVAEWLLKQAEELTPDEIDR